MNDIVERDKQSKRKNMKHTNFGYEAENGNVTVIFR